MSIPVNLNPDGLPVPTDLRHPSFLITRQRPAHNAIDFEAVMASKESLREWSHSDWPEDDFTLEANLEDLEGHIEDHEADLGYGFSILEPDEGRLLGSLYLEPVAPFLDNYVLSEALRSRLAEFDVRVEYWLRNGTPDELERQFIEATLDWLASDWWFSQPIFGTRTRMERRRALYRELGFSDQGRIASPEGERYWHFHVPPGRNR